MNFVWDTMETSPEEIRERKVANLWEGFFSLGLQYYIAGRSSYFSQLNPTTGNQLHHAVELMLKGFLSRKRGSDIQGIEPEKITNWLRNRFGHDLLKLWSAFIDASASPYLNQYDGTIAELHKFEEIRYPDKLAFEGGTVNIGFESSDISLRNYTQPFPTNNYTVALAPIDHLVKIIFDSSSINPAFFTHSLNQVAASMLIRDNQVQYDVRLKTPQTVKSYGFLRRLLRTICIRL